MEMKIERQAQHVADYDIIVAGGGVAGVAAAVSARRMGKRVLLVEKSVGLGGLATTGLINLFVPLDNGRGIQIIRGMAQELLELAVRYGYDTIPEVWRNGEPEQGEMVRYQTRFSAPIFTLALTEFVKEEGVDLLFDSVITQPVMEGRICRGIVAENKSGCVFYGAGLVVDATGDGDVLYRAGVPMIQGQNYHTYVTFGTDLESCRKAVEKGSIAALYSHRYRGGTATLYGDFQPEGKRLWNGTSAADITQYLVENHKECLDKIRNDDRWKRTILALPSMPQFRTTRHVDGDYTLKVEDAWHHFEDSVAVICDFDRRDYLYEVPYGTLIRSGFPNLITAGRVAAASGYAWDVLRVIPPAILTGQAAGTAAAIAVETGKDISCIDIKQLQEKLSAADVMIHFDDSLVPEGERPDTDAKTEEHI